MDRSKPTLTHSMCCRRQVTLRRMAGFTLIELMVTVAILAILLAIANPSFQSITNSNRIAAELNGLLGDLQYARAEAIKQGQSITVCVSSDGSACSGSTDWRNGWIAFLDTDSSNSISGAEFVLRRQKPFTGSDTLQATNNVAAVVFNREGLATGIANGTLVKLHTVPANSNWTRCLSITLIGQMTAQKYGDMLNGVQCT